MHQFDKIIREIEIGHQQDLPPVQSWQPEVEVSMDLHIDAQGNWFHDGEPFVRESLVCLFESILRKDGDDYFLVTPVEKVKVAVDDVPILFDAVIVESNNVHLITKTGLNLDLSLPQSWELRDFGADATSSIQVPYCKLRDDLWGRIDRHVFYQLVEHALSNDSAQEGGTLSFQVGEQIYPLGSLED